MTTKMQLETALVAALADLSEVAERSRAAYQHYIDLGRQQDIISDRCRELRHAIQEAPEEKL